MFVCCECGASQAVTGACAGCGGSTFPQTDDPLLGASVGPYRIARLLGVGGMGRVYKGVQPQIGSRVAVKVLSRECTDRKDLVERFFSEARAVNLIRHESIVNVLDLAMLPDGRPYIVMEYLDGAPLSDLVSRLGAMPLGGVARLCVEVLDALGAAHAKGIVHRDLKPDNIYVTPAGRAKVLDFGIAKLLPELGGSFTQTGSLLGTPHYMSPEQAAGKNVDFRTDLYAMGVILFECATGQKPFTGDSMFDLLRKHVDLPPPAPRSLRGDLPPAFEHVILAALAKDPNQRFPSAAAMAAALQQGSAGLAAEQWAVISGSPAGIASATPSGAGWGTPASWPGAGRPPLPGSAPAPLPPPPPYGAGPGTPGPYPPTVPQRGPGHAGPAGYSPPYAPPPFPGQGYGGPPAQHYPSTATSGQAVGRGSPGKKTALWWGLGLLAIAAVSAAAMVLIRGRSDSGPAAPAAVSGGGVATTPSPALVGDAGPALGSAGAASADDPADVPDPDDTGGSGQAQDPPAGADGSAAPTPSSESLGDELRDMQKLVASLPPEQRAIVAQQLKLVERQIRALPPAQRKLVLEQLHTALAQAQAATAGTPAERDDDNADDDSGKATDAADPSAGTGAAPLPARWDGKRFDVMAYLPSAVAAARKVAPDAQLFRIDAEAVLPDGIVDLSQGTVRYGFISKARAARPANVPLGGKWDPNCQVNVWVEASGIEVREFSGCKETPVPLPRCSLKQRWQQAVAKGAPKDNAIAELGYRANVINGKPIWFFSIGDAFDDGPSPDACP
jgi:Protein kinase domain